MKNYNELFSERMTELMSEKSYTQQLVSEKTGLDRAQVETYQNGAVVPSGLVLVKLGDFFGVSLDYLMGRTTARMVCDPADVTYRKIQRCEIHERTLSRIAKLFNYHKTDLERLDRALYRDVRRMNDENEKRTDAGA